jgi:NADH-quinone oxidoreductase subunit L
MTVPLVILAACAMLLSLVAWPAPWLQHTLDPQFHAEPGGVSLMVLSILLVALGLGTGWAIYAKNPRAKSSAADPLGAKIPGIFAALAARLGFDELYSATVGRLSAATAVFADLLDRYVWNGAIQLLGRLGEFGGVVNRDTDEDLLNGGFDNTSAGLRGVGRLYSRLQTGEAHSYLRFIAIGFVVLALVLTVGGGR